MINLSKRLSCIYNMVTDSKIVADIGCDHALLDICLLLNNKINKSIACDITLGAINQALRNVNKYNVKNIDLRLEDGLKALNEKDNVDTIILSGLGNTKIINILKDDIHLLNNVNTIIIQSNTMPDMIRSEVTKLGYKIQNEVLVLDNKIIYEVIKFTKGKKRYSKRQIYFGPVLLNNKDKLFYMKYENEITKNKEVLEKIPKKKIVNRLKIKRLIRKLKRELKKGLS